LRFWQQDASLRFDHVLPIRRGQKQYRHDAHGSVMKLNHHAEPLPAAAPSGYRELMIAREGVEEPRSMVDPDGNRVRLVPPGLEWHHPTSHKDGSPEPQRTLQVSYGDILRLRRTAPVGRSGLSASERASFFWRKTAPRPSIRFGQALGWRYITLQIADIDTVHNDLRKQGRARGSCAGNTWKRGADIGWILDPDGNWIELSRRASIVGSLA